jgi:hypothetical protein
MVSTLEQQQQQQQNPCNALLYLLFIYFFYRYKDITMQCCAAGQSTGQRCRCQGNAAGTCSSRLFSQ